MALFRRTKSTQTSTGFIETLQVNLTLQHGDYGNQHDRLRIDRLVSDCRAILDDHDVVFKGDIYGDATAQLSFVCPNAVEAWMRIRSIILSNFQMFPISITIEHHLDGAKGGRTTRVHRRHSEGD
jgi:hypothetical protein